MPLMQALKDRKSSREFSEKDIPQQMLSNLLWAAFGINRKDSGMRTAPSACNFQEIEIYAAMKEGLYKYDPPNNTLILTLSEDIREKTGIQKFTQTAPVNLIFVADLSKMGSIAKDMKEFYSATDTGYISQNVYLFCASNGLSTVVLGWVDKEALSKTMQLKPEQKIILTQPVGYSKE